MPLDTTWLTNMNWADLATDVTAIGTLGTAAFGLVDATKLVRGGVSSAGFIFLRRTIQQLTPEVPPPPESVGTASAPPGLPPSISATSQGAILELARANWINGVGMADQKTAIKALLKLRLAPDNAMIFARLTGVDPAVLSSVAAKLASGDPMLPSELDTYGRFDLLLTSTLDSAFMRADQRYRNAAKLVAGVIAVMLAEIAAFSLVPGSPFKDPLFVRHAFQALITGIIATPLAPIAKDISTTLSNATKTLQSLRK
jgi:hypothetical protein